MNISFSIARRYLFAKKTTNAIHIISGIAVFGIAIGTAALILILSVFNGFEDLFLSLYNSFNPDVTVSPAKGKTFVADSAWLDNIYRIEGVNVISQTLEEKALFDYKENKDIGLLKGVDEHYIRVTGIDTAIREGVYSLMLADVPMAVIGQGLRNKLGVDIEDPFSPLYIFWPKRKRGGIFNSRPFKSAQVQPVGTFLVQQDFENQYVLTDIDLVRDLLEAPGACTALEIDLSQGWDVPSTFERIREAVGEDFVVKNRYEQEDSFLKLMRIEKWLSFAIVGLMMLLVSFNMIGALWMIVLEKQRDIAILKSMGMTDQGVYRIFLYEGWLMCAVGILTGFVLAVTIYILQKTVGLITLPGGMLIDAYPVSLRWYDFPLVALTVFIIGWLAAIMPARRARRVSAIIHSE
ncbi:MAG: FtsX-like permease family protein [Saprospiraceae bacterium]